MQCPNCGAPIGPDEVFCGECGASLARPTPPVTPIPSPPPAPGRRRRPVLWIALGVGGCALLLVVGCLVLVALGGMALLIPAVAEVAQATATHTPSPPTPTTRPTATPPMPSPTPTQPADQPDYEADFGAQTTGWPTAATPDYSQGIENGEYHIRLGLPNTVYRAILKDQRFKDFDAEVEARLVEGPTTGAYALIFRYQDGENYYIFRVLTSGHYWLSKREAGQWTSLVDKTESVYIHQGQATNRLRVECAGYWIRLYVNDQYLTAVLDTSFQDGQIGLAANTWADAGIHVAFDNFKVWKH